VRGQPVGERAPVVDDDAVPLVAEGLEVLTEAECLALAATRAIGRVAVSIAALPAVFPVNYCIRDGDVYFRTAPGTKLDAATREAVVAFQVDDFEAFGHTGWSVLIVGPCAEVPGEELVELEPLRVQPWAHGDRHHVVRIRGELVSGRRIAALAGG